MRKPAKTLEELIAELERIPKGSFEISALETIVYELQEIKLALSRNIIS